MVQDPDTLALGEKAAKTAKSAKVVFLKSGISLGLAYLIGEIVEVPNPSIPTELLARLRKEGYVADHLGN